MTEVKINNTGKPKRATDMGADFDRRLATVEKQLVELLVDCKLLEAGAAHLEGSEEIRQTLSGYLSLVENNDLLIDRNGKAEKC